MMQSRQQNRRLLVALVAVFGSFPSACTAPASTLLTESLLEPVIAPEISPGSSGRPESWLLVLMRSDLPMSCLCSDSTCQVQAAARAVRDAAIHNVDALVLSGEDSDLVDNIEVQRASNETGVMVLRGRRRVLEDTNELTSIYLRSKSAATEAGTGPARTDSSATIDGADEGANELSSVFNVLRHPCASASRTAPDADSQLLDNIHAVEVDGPAFVNPACARRQWHRWLQQGRRLVAVSASASFGVDAWPYRYLNLVRVSQRDGDEILNALTSGHTQIVHHTNSRPRVLLGVDVDGDGRFDDVRQGDLVAQSSQKPMLRVRVVGARGADLVMYTEAADGAVSTQHVHSRDEVFAWYYSVPEKGIGFVRAELYRGSELVVLTNPLFLRRALDVEKTDD